MGTQKLSQILPLFQGMLPLSHEQVVHDILAGVTLAALALPEVLGYTKIAGTPVITGIYTMLLPMLLYGVFGASRHLVVGADSPTAPPPLAAILAARRLSKRVPGALIAVAGAILAASFLPLEQSGVHLLGS